MPGPDLVTASRQEVETVGAGTGEPVDAGG